MMRRGNLRAYIFYCEEDGDNMSARIYNVVGDSVVRHCFVPGTWRSIRQRIPRCQAAREIRQLSQFRLAMRKVYDNAA